MKFSTLGKTNLFTLLLVLFMGSQITGQAFVFTTDLEEEIAVCEGDQLLLIAAVSGGTAPYSFEWEEMTPAGGFIPYSGFGSITNGASNTQLLTTIFSSNNSDAYRVVATDANGNEIISVVTNIFVRTVGSLTCNDHINMSLSEFCDIDQLNPTPFVEGENEDSPLLSVFILAPSGSPIDPQDLGDYAGKTLTFEVVSDCTGNKCWGTVSLEDKILPTLENCGCPVLGSNNRDAYAEICRLKCYQKDLIQNGIEDVLTCDYLPYPVPMDNCQEYPAPYRDLEDLVWSDEWIQGDCQQWWLRRTFRLMADKYNPSSGGYTKVVADECVFEFFTDAYGVSSTDTIGLDNIAEFNAINDSEVLNNSLFLPVNFIELSCNIDPTPEFLASLSGFDLPGNPAPSGDNTTTVGDINVEESNQGIPYAYPFYMGKGWACMSHPQRISAEACNINVDYTDQILESCGINCYGNSKTIREWTILDWCEGDVIKWNQLIKTVDTEAPTMAVNDITASVDPWSCDATVQLPQPNFLHDNCDDNNVTYSVSSLSAVQITGNATTGFVASGLSLTNNGQPHVFYYEPVDCCGNQNSYTMTVTVIDRTAPVAITLQNVVLSLTSLNPDPNGIGKIFAQDIDNGSYDQCSQVSLEIRRASDVCGIVGNMTFNNDGHSDDDDDDLDDGKYVTFCCDDLEDDGSGNLIGEVDVVLRVWDDADKDGVYGSNGDNFNESWSTIRIEDKLGVSAQCPPNLVLTCDMSKDDLGVTGVPGPSIGTCMSIAATDTTYSDNPKLKRPSDAPELNSQIPSLDGSWPPFDPVCRIGAIERTWNCGVQWILFVDNGEEFNPNTIVFPDDQTVECLDFTYTNPTWDEVSCELIGYSAESDTFNFEQGACYKILHHHTVINWCEYDPNDPDIANPGSEDGLVPGIWKHTQELKLFDDINPSLEYIGETCFEVNENCQSDEITLEMVGDDMGDCASPWLKWEVVIDLWGDGTPDHTYTSFTLSNNPFYLVPTARGETLSVVIPEGVDASRNGHPVFITLSDGCGNVVSQTVDIQIVDKKKPTPYCLNLSTALMSNGGVELWACDFNAGSFDNCSDQSFLRYTFSAVNPDTLNATQGVNETYDPVLKCSSKEFTDADNANADSEGLIPVDVYVWDEYGNYDFCTVRLRLLDNLGSKVPIEGVIQTENDLKLENVDVTIFSSAPEYPVTVKTDSEGQYAFSENPMFFEYQIEASKNDNFLNGVSTLDLVLIQRHVLGLTVLESPYKLIAADVNSDQKISAIDLIELRKLILGVYQEFPQNQSWRFVEKNAQMEESNPWPFSETIDIFSLQGQMMNEDYVAIKTGDVNESVKVDNNRSSSNRSKSLNINLSKVDFNSGDRVSIDVRSSNFDDIIGVQFSLRANGLKLIDVESGKLSVYETNVYQNQDGNLSFSWNSMNAMRASTDEVLFSLVFNAIENGSSSEITLTESFMEAEAYLGNDFEIVDVELEDHISDQITLYQNQPNPFNGSTLIEFDLKNTGNVNLSITDMSGRLVKEYNQVYTSGRNSLKINRADLSTAGIFYYTLTSGDFSDTKKMILLN